MADALLANPAEMSPAASSPRRARRSTMPERVGSASAAKAVVGAAVTTIILQ